MSDNVIDFPTRRREFVRYWGTRRRRGYTELVPYLQEVGGDDEGQPALIGEPRPWGALPPNSELIPPEWHWIFRPLPREFTAP